MEAPDLTFLKLNRSKLSKPKNVKKLTNWRKLSLMRSKRRSKLPARELKKRRSKSKLRDTIKIISLKEEPGVTYPHEELTKRRNRDNTIWT